MILDFNYQSCENEIAFEEMLIQFFHTIFALSEWKSVSRSKKEIQNVYRQTNRRTEPLETSLKKKYVIKNLFKNIMSSQMTLKPNFVFCKLSLSITIFMLHNIHFLKC